MKKALYLLFALVCAPLCTQAAPSFTPAQTYAETLTKEFPNYTRTELKYALNSAANVLDAMADTVENTTATDSQTLITINTLISVYGAVARTPYKYLPNEDHAYVEAMQEIQHACIKELEGLKSDLESGKVTERQASAKLTRHLKKAETECDLLDAQYPEAAKKLNAGAGAELGVVMREICGDEVTQAVADYQKKHPDATQDELTTVQWRRSSRLFRQIADSL